MYFLLWIFVFMTEKVFANQSVSDTQAKQAVVDFSSKMVDLLQGPIIKVVAGIVLIAGVASLLRGKHHVAVSCGMAFVILLFLPWLVSRVGG